VGRLREIRRCFADQDGAGFYCKPNVESCCRRVGRGGTWRFALQQRRRVLDVAVPFERRAVTMAHALAGSICRRAGSADKLTSQSWRRQVRPIQPAHVRERGGDGQAIGPATLLQRQAIAHCTCGVRIGVRGGASSTRGAAQGVMGFSQWMTLTARPSRIRCRAGGRVELGVLKCPLATGGRILPGNTRHTCLPTPGATSRTSSQRGGDLPRSRPLSIAPAIDLTY
jgi:hypothetical protein